MTALKTKPEKKTQAASDPHAYLDALLEKLGPRFELSEPELTMLFGPSIASRLPGWIENKVVSKNGGAIDPKTRRSTGWKYDLGEVIAAIRGSGECFPETETATALLNGEWCECVDPDKPYLLSEVTALFCIPSDKLVKGIHDKLLVDVSPENQREEMVRGSDLLNWIDSSGIPTVLTIAAAATIAKRRRFLESNPELPEAQPTIVDDAFNAIMAKEIAEQAEAAKQRNGLLIKYRSIIHRHAKPEDSDAKELAEVCRALGYSREHVQADISALEKINALSQFATDAYFQKAKVESEAVAVEKKALELRHRSERDAFDKRASQSRAALRNALESGSAINSIKTERSELFGS